MAEIPVAIISSGYTYGPGKLGRYSRSRLTTHSRIRIYGTAVDIEIVFRQHFWALVYGSSRSIENSTEHVFRNSELQTVPSKLDFSLVEVNDGFGNEIGRNYLPS